MSRELELPTPLLTIAEAADFFHVSRSTIYHWTSERPIPHIKLSPARGGRVLFRRSDLAAWLESRTVAPVT